MWDVLKRVVDEREIKIMVYWSAVSAALQGITLSLLIPFLRALYAREEATNWLIAVVVCGVITFTVEALALRHSNKVSVYYVCDTMLQRVSNKVLNLPLGWFSAANQAKVATTNTTHVSTLSHLGQMLIPQLTSAFIVPIVLVIAVLFFDWRLSVIMLAAVLPLWLVWKSMRVSITRSNEVSTTAAVSAAARLVEFARLQPVLRAVGVAGSWQPVISAVDADTKAAAQAMKIQGRPAQFFLIIVNAVFAVVLACGVAFVFRGSMEPVVFVVILATVARTTFPLAQASLLAGELDNTTVAASSVAEILDTDTLPEPSVPASPANSDVVLADVSFSYEERQILHQLSLTAPAGEMTAIVGPSGSGKTTILRLIARFWDVNSGSVKVGGVNVKDMPHDQLMGMVSMVFQDVYLFNTTIRENLRIARPDATDEELQEAARRARLDVAIEALPHGWDTQVGPAGLSLSGGERQRVAIARAFIKDAPILLLDEITSALDGENESAIAEVITELAKGRTVIVVAHRLNTIRNADSIYVLGVGKDGAYVAQHGTSAELSKQPGPFRDFKESSQAVTRWQIKS
ncbi:ABC transporter ATP-binding protein [Corynebacterium cystitidis]|uniref:ATP-binding cassette, subfamily B n=1 Tax=Corynebacterium cystitidis DSM 20524 TaxID=1121357 RepID=A0A1H9UTZ1_9CORY|nr:ABC transporter ATP-binding protein [Corynebacterium cystitidis]WJY83714.1 Iron import ATP-binding/permease protein IrtB [Corynebacterium cystitidis DSM 20524]SES12882.1 ATP-binding cassette, subfamily B [Corynebacterium cystitidis DSM 20524]SNV91188.1 ABC transporter ATP-binding protein/permease [Corynebacterium cystitidis]